MVPVQSAALGPFSDLQGETMSKLEEVVAPAAIGRALEINSYSIEINPSFCRRERHSPNIFTG